MQQMHKVKSVIEYWTLEVNLFFLLNYLQYEMEAGEKPLHFVGVFVVNPEWHQQKTPTVHYWWVLQYLRNHSITCLCGTEAVYELLAASVWDAQRESWSKRI